MNRNDIQKMIDDNATNNMWRVSDIPAHTHTGVDSNQVDYYSLTNRPFIGIVYSDGTNGNLPHGWVSSKTGTGAYLIVHNLNQTLYNVTANILGTIANSFSVMPALNSFTVNTYNGAGTPTDMNFNFILNLIRK